VAAVRGCSGIDVMLVGLDLMLAEVLQHLEPVEEALGRKVNPTCYTPQEFEQRRATPDSFVYKVLSQPTIAIFRGVDDGC
jgi:predicted transcriptional regulator